MDASDQNRGHHAAGGRTKPTPAPWRYSFRASANFCASPALNGLKARWHRLKIVEAVTEMNFASPSTSVAHRYLAL